MITIQDWIATIPEEDRHLAYVGEHQSVTRQFLLTGDGWQDYVDWGFHLDMAFDLSTVTTRDIRQLEDSKVESSETVSDTLVKTSATTKKEKYIVSDVTVDCHSETDIAYLTKQSTEEGLLLVWTVLNQHTQLPGRLWANIRAVGPDGQVKKSAVMVFDVGASVTAEPAADLPESEMAAMEQHMDEMLSAVLQNAQTVESHMGTTQGYMSEAKDYARQAELAVINAQNIQFDVTQDIEGIDERVQTVVYENAVQDAALNSLRLEMEDLRIAHVNTRYSSAGEAVRSQVGLAMMEIGQLRSQVEEIPIITVDDVLDDVSTNPVQNKLLAAELDSIWTELASIESILTRLNSAEEKIEQMMSTLNNHLNNYP